MLPTMDHGQAFRIKTRPLHPNRDHPPGSSVRRAMGTCYNVSVAYLWLLLWVFDATFKEYFICIVWPSVLLMEETCVPGKKHRPRSQIHT
jgi:hypothetical protein